MCKVLRSETETNFDRSLFWSLRMVRNPKGFESGKGDVTEETQIFNNIYLFSMGSVCSTRKRSLSQSTIKDMKFSYYGKGEV
jgi:hypothetical protein